MYTRTRKHTCMLSLHQTSSVTESYLILEGGLHSLELLGLVLQLVDDQTSASCAHHCHRVFLKRRGGGGNKIFFKHTKNSTISRHESLNGNTSNHQTAWASNEACIQCIKSNNRTKKGTSG